jgi:hypothetical protein
MAEWASLPPLRHMVGAYLGYEGTGFSDFLSQVGLI